VAVADADRVRLAHAGVNTLLAVRGGSRTGVSPRTLGAGGGPGADGKYLSARRLALFIAASVEQGTRWVLLEHNARETWRRARAQVENFLCELAAEGAFPGARAQDNHFVICDERVNTPLTLAEGKFNLLFGFATSKPGAFDTWLVTHRAGASRVRPVSVNRWEVASSILRG
jgi:phage tail sheath protein FI